MLINGFHCIWPIENSPSVIDPGVLFYKRAEKLRHRPVAMKVIQDRRKKVRVTGGRRFHQCANLTSMPEIPGRTNSSRKHRLSVRSEFLQLHFKLKGRSSSQTASLQAVVLDY
ncbi:MAG: hypothetical protein M2R45_04060 [Verrucomicrobia subdivision 3 bacterium]|nr:hypothetical protein [Limisphaerales bacterium]MCS1416999.1 hypothetical protein [Limisphaerales bacterium]